MITNEQKIENKVYYVDPEDKEVIFNPIAIRPSIYLDRIQWDDTARGTYIIFKDIKISPEGDIIEIFAGNGSKVVLRELDIETYNKKIKELVSGRPDFQSTEELRNYYLNTNFELY